ncbi:MAG: DUF3822 family protein [Bacteroidia bacterium]|nr:DUF3822 family protein [Bacteroidia bacterium]
MKEQTLVTGNNISFQKAISIDNWFREDSSNSILGLCINSASIQFCVYQLREDSFQLFESYSFQNISSDSLNDFLSEEKITKLNYAGIVCSFSDLPVTLVPKPLFDERLALDYLEFVQGSKKDVNVYYQNIGSDIVSVFGIDSSMVSTIAKHLPTAVFTNKSNKLVENFITSRVEKECLLILNDDVIEIIVAEESKLHFYNSFKYKSTEDLLYFVMMAYDQFGLNSSKSVLNINGGIDKESNVFKALNKYISKICFYPVELTFKTSSGFKDIPIHYASSLFYNIYENYRRKIQG